MTTRTNKKRGESDYENENLSKGINVLLALEGNEFEPVSIRQVMERTGFSRDFCFRALKTLKLKGFAVESEQGQWSAGPKLLKFSQRYSEVVIAALNK